MPFSGIVEEMGVVLSYEQSAEMKLWDGSIGTGVVLKVAAAVVTDGAYLGCSIAVNGTCLTVTEFTAAWFTVNVSPETLRLTNLGTLAADDKVNLERAMAADGRNSGHMVQGHVDDTGTVASARRDGEALWVTIEVPTRLLKYIVKKGYIAIDGTSLTVCEVDHSKAQFSVMLIAHTQSCVILPHKGPGSKVNIEVDVIGKYVEASVGPRLAALEALVTGKEAGSTAGWEPPATTPAPAAAAGSGSGSLTAAPGATGAADSEITEITSQLQVTDNQHGVGLQVPMPTAEQAAPLKIGIVRTCWHSELIDLMESKCITALVEGGVQKPNILRARVSGSFELPFVSERLITKHKVDAVIAIGILLKGGTIHMEVIANATTKAMLDVQLKTSTPVVFGVLTVFSIDQARERAESDLGGSWGQAALSQAMWSQEDTSALIEDATSA